MAIEPAEVMAVDQTLNSLGRIFLVQEVKELLDTVVTPEIVIVTRDCIVKAAGKRLRYPALLKGVGFTIENADAF